MDEYFLGLRQQIDHRTSRQSSANSSIATSGATDSLGCMSSESNECASSTLKLQIEGFLNPENPLFAKRLDKTLNHRVSRSSKMTDEKQGNGNDVKERRVRGDCIACCNKCDAYRTETTITGSHTRIGRKTVDFCNVCQVYLCVKCFNTFHDDEIPTLPPCTEKKYGLQSRRRLRMSSSEVSTSPTCTRV